MHETQVHLQKGKQRTVTELGNAADGVWKRVVNDLGSLAGQGVDREASLQPGQSLWRKRRGQGTSVHERDPQK